MAEDSIDPEAALLIPFSVATAVTLGLVDSSILPIISLDQVLISIDYVDITLARLISIATILAVTINRDAGLTQTSGVDFFIAYATVGLIVAPPLVPILEDTLASGLVSVIAFGVQSTGFLLISYTN